MRSIRVIFLFLLAISVFAQRPVTIDDALQYKTVADLRISPDGRRVAYVVSQADFEEDTLRTNIHLVDAQGASIKLTNAPKHDTSPRWSPDGKSIAFLSDRDAKGEKVGKRQVWVISPDGGEAWQLTREKYAVSSFDWAPDGKRLAVVASEPENEDEEKRKKEKDDALVVESNLRPARIFLVSVPDGKSELLYGTTRHVSSISFSPSGREIAFADQPTPKVPDNFYSTVRILDLTTKQVRAVGPTREMSSVDPKFAPDGRHLAFESFASGDWPGFGRLYIVPAAGGAAKPLTAAFDEEPRGFDWLEDSSGVIFSGSRGVDQNLYRVSLDGKVEPLYEGGGVSRLASISSGQIAFLHETPSVPVEVYLATLTKKSAFQPKRLTNLNPQIRDLALGKTEVVRWKNRNDGLDLDGLLIKPPDYVEGKRYPLLVVVHGGPAGVFNSAFTLRRSAYPVQVFASRGYVVFLPNPRGSGGYGEKFRRANVKDWGNADYFDIQHGVDELISRGIADPNRMGIMGWSYGGFMTSWTITQTDRFKAASVGAGVTNLFSFYGTTDIPPFIESYFGARPWQDRDLMAKHSAMYFIDRVKTPTLIQHGTEDRRVPLSQGEELYTALRSQGVPVEMIKYPRSEHAITEPKLIRDALRRNVEWFDRYIKGDREAAKWHSVPAPSSGK